MIQSASLLQTLKNIPLFQSLKPSDLEDISSVAHIRHCVRGQDLFTMGQEANTLFVIQTGWIKLYRTSKDGEEVIIHIFGPRESFAEAAVFSDTQVYPVHAQAVDDTTLIEIPRNFFLQKIEQDSNFALRILGAIAARQHYLVQQLEQVTTRTAPQRVGAFLIRFCDKTRDDRGGLLVNLPYDKSIISTRLNIKAETFSRAVAKLAPHGVTQEGGRIFITDMLRLADFCDVPSKDIPCA